MQQMTNRILIAACAFLVLVLGAAAQRNDAEAQAWNQPVEPFRIVGNVYYVGASGVTAFLITTPQGHILLDGGLPITAPLIEKSIRTLGFSPQDVKYLLLSHAHFDHAGGLAELKRTTKARLLVSREDAPMLRSGGKGDFSFGDRFVFPAVEPDQLIENGQAVSLGGTTLTAHVTPGHTKGCTTWTMTANEGGRAHPVLFHCSTTVPGHRLVNNAAYPEIVADYEGSFRTLRALPCDVLLAPHAGFFQLQEKRGKMREGGANPFVDAKGCAAFIERSATEFRAELERQRKAAQNGG